MSYEAFRQTLKCHNPVCTLVGQLLEVTADRDLLLRQLRGLHDAHEKLKKQVDRRLVQEQEATVRKEPAG